MQWLMVILSSLLMIVSTFGIVTRSHQDQPVRMLWGNPAHITWSARDHVWINTNLREEGWVRADMRRAYADPRLVETLRHGERVPVRRTHHLVFRRQSLRRPEVFSAGVLIAPAIERRRRLLLINPEPSQEHERAWPHLGLLAVGTTVQELGWDVTLWDELIQGPIPLESLVQTGDVVGFSLVVTGMERGISLAMQAKQLGASYTIAGNDAAIFRAKQLLAHPHRPFDAVFTSNSTNAVRAFFRTLETSPSTVVPSIEGVATNVNGVVDTSNEQVVLRRDLVARKQRAQVSTHDPLDGFVIPDVRLYDDAYWQTVWQEYRTRYAHKHTLAPDQIRNATIHLAQGCTRTRGTDVCSYCTIYGVGDIRLPDADYLRALTERYQEAGLNHLYNTTDSAFEMAPLVRNLRAVNFQTDGLVIYGRAEGLATQPRLLDEWQRLVRDRLLINVGLDSGDVSILEQGVIKSSSSRGNRLQENRQAILNLRGSGAHLHAALIFGSPGESRDSCERTLDYAQWIADTLGPQLDLLESDLYWLNFGSPASRVFRDYDYATELAAIAGKAITYDTWWTSFGQHADALSVPWETECAWYQHFTHLDIDEARAYNQRLAAIMHHHPGHIPGREFAFKPPTT